jgi:hypothetical protein
MLIPYTKSSMDTKSYFHDGLAVYSDGTPDLEFHSRADYQQVASLDGFKNPDWKAQVANHSNATTPLVADMERVDVAPHAFIAFVTHTGPAWSAVETHTNPCIHSFLGGQALDHSFDEIAESYAKARFSQKLREIHQKFQGGVFLGELRETFHMLRNPLSGLRKGIELYGHLLRKKQRGLVRAPKRRKAAILRDTWLEQSYGWTPFFSDIKGILETMTTNFTFPDEYVNIGASGTYTDRGPLIFVDQQSTHRVVWNRSRYDETKASVRITGQVRVRPIGSATVESSTVDKLKGGLRRWGLTRDNFFPTVWNLLPGSFLIDYFSNVGDVIDGMSLHTGDLVWSSMTSRTTTSRVAVCIPFSYEGDNGLLLVTCGGGSASCVSWKKRVRREVPSTIVPRLRFGFDELNLRKLTNIVALTKNIQSLTPY